LMLAVFTRIRRVAPHFRTALVTGATGTGKELVATALHRLSPVAAGRFAVVNCSAVVETLFESELFGHVKGAFTGAAQDKVGLFEYANGGTVFLDEIGDMPLETQSKLLRVLENGEIQRVGSPVVRQVNVRVIAATNRSLPEMMAEKRFREDLYYRLSMVEISLPGLRERKEDLPLLARHFIEQFSAQYGKAIRGLTPRAELLLGRYSWPGNVRELKSALGNACMMADGDMIDVRDLPEQLRSRASEEPAEQNELLPLAEMERSYVLRVLESVGGNKVRAAKILGINRATVYRIVEGRPTEEAATEA
jgi:transcriptional regulator with PAS, ATPase and Fis domain